MKTSIRGLGANKTANSIMRVSKVIHVLSPVVNNFDSEKKVEDMEKPVRKRT